MNSNKVTMENMSGGKMEKSQNDTHTFQSTEILLIVRIENLVEFTKIKACFEKLGKDFSKVYRGKLSE